MCGGGAMPLPLWLALPLVAGSVVIDVGKKATRGVGQVAEGAHRQARGTASALKHLLLPPDALNDAIAADPKNPHLYLQRARASLTVAGQADANTTKKLLEDIIQDTQHAVELLRSQGHSQLPLIEGLVLLGLALDRLGRWDEAAATFDDAVTAHQVHMKHEAKDNEKQTKKAKEEEGEEEEEEEAEVEDSTEKQTPPQHRYVVTTFKKPTFCDHCRSLLVGLRNQGLECTECKSTLHAKCSAQHQAPCRAAPNAHGLRLVDFHVPTSCAQCWLPLLGLSKQGLHCAVCQASVHERCTDAFVRARPVCRPPAARSLIPRLAEAAYKEGPVDAGQKQQQQLPSLAELQNLHGLALYHGAHYEEAIVLFTAAHAQPREEGEAKAQAQYMSVANRGLCHFYLERLDEAVADLSEAIEHGVATEQVFSTRATAFQLLGRDDLAAADRRRALLCDPNAVVKVFPYALPLELVVHVFSFLSERDRVRCAQTCHLWHDLLRRKTDPSLLDAAYAAQW